MTRLPFLAAGLLAGLAAVPAFAGAWTQAKGRGQAIVTGLYSHSGKGYDGKGDVVDIADYAKSEAYALVEYGLTDRLTLMINPSLRHVSVEGGDDTSGLGYTELGGRYRLTTDQSFVFSVQATARIPGAKRRDNLAQVGATDEEYDVRALAGVPFKIGTKDAFVDLQGGYRFRAGSPPNEYHADATFGVRPAANFLVMAQVLNTFSDGAGAGVFTSYRYHNAYLSGVYDLDSRWSLQIGGLATLGGRNALRERGLTTAIWYRF